MSVDSSISYAIGELKPEEEAEIEIMMTVHENQKNLAKIEEENRRFMKEAFCYFLFYTIMKQEELQQQQK